MNNKKPNNQFYLILILGLLTAIGPFSIDMYLPALLVLPTEGGSAEYCGWIVSQTQDPERK